MIVDGEKEASIEEILEGASADAIARSGQESVARGQRLALTLGCHLAREKEPVTSSYK